MKQLLGVTTIVAAMLLTSQAAHAGNVFLLQLAVMSSKENADNAYKKAAQEYNKQLKGYRYLPQRSQTISGDEDNWRVLVGPFKNRKLANRVCADLKSKGQDCFIVETAAIAENDIPDNTLEAAPAQQTMDKEASDDVAVETPSTSTVTSITADNRKGDVSSLMPWN